MIRGELWWTDLGVPYSSEQGFKRPTLIIQDDSFNKSKIQTIIVLPLTTNLNLIEAPGNVYIKKEESNLSRDSVLNVSQISVIDKTRLIERIGKLSRGLLHEVENGIRLVLGPG